MSRAFLAALHLSGLRCVVVGSDREAADKTRRLLDAGAAVTLIGEALPDATVEDLSSHGGALTVARRAFVDADLDPRPALVVVSPGDDALCARLWSLSAERGFLLCCIDRPAWCHVTNVAVVEAGEVTLGLASGGAVPGLLRRLREDLRAGLGGAFPAFTRYVADVRAMVAHADRRRAVADALSGFQVEVRVHLPLGWKDRWRALNPDRDEASRASLPPAHPADDPGETP